MLPFVGPHYYGPDHRRTLLLGESNYLEDACTVHKDAAAWYAGTQAALTAKEVDWIDCRRLLTKPWRDPSKVIYREISRCLEDVGVAHRGRGMSAVAFMNAFQRPATTMGGSMKSCMKEVDRAKSLEVIVATVRALTSELVIFTSRFAAKVFRPALRGEFPTLQVESVCHPGGPFHWRTPGYAHGRDRLMAILRKSFMTETTSAGLCSRGEDVGTRGQVSETA